MKNNNILIYILDILVIICALLGIFNVFPKEIIFSIGLFLIGITFLIRMLEVKGKDKKQVRKYLFGIIFIVIIILLNLFIK